MTQPKWTVTKDTSHPRLYPWMLPWKVTSPHTGEVWSFPSQRNAFRYAAIMADIDALLTRSRQPHILGHHTVRADQPTSRTPLDTLGSRTRAAYGLYAIHGGNR